MAFLATLSVPPILGQGAEVFDWTGVEMSSQRFILGGQSASRPSITHSRPSTPGSIVGRPSTESGAARPLLLATLSLPPFQERHRRPLKYKKSGQPHRIWQWPPEYRRHPL